MCPSTLQESNIHRVQYLTRLIIIPFISIKKSTVLTSDRLSSLQLTELLVRSQGWSRGCSLFHQRLFEAVRWRSPEIRKDWNVVRCPSPADLNLLLFFRFSGNLRDGRLSYRIATVNKALRPQHHNRDFCPAESAPWPYVKSPALGNF